jgi:cyclophilin family peptidyl-prolyl cis-trans isomerase
MMAFFQVNGAMVPAIIAFLRPANAAGTTRLPRLICRSAALVLAWAILLSCAGVSQSAIIRFATSVGNIDVRLYSAATPNSVANFLNYANSNRYNGTFIHRVPQKATGGTSNFVVQGGGFKLNNSIFSAAGITTDPPIADEPGITNIRGTLAFAKNSLGATSQWFFNIGDNSFLDAQNFTVFGRVVGNGITVVDSINNLQTVNASSAQNAAGEDFDEVPVLNLQTVLNQNDITSSDAVMINGVTNRNLPAGDYDFNGTVNAADYNIWKSSFGSTTNAAADGNGDGVVNAADYSVWRDTFGQTSGSGATSINGIAVPEPAAALLLTFAATVSWLTVRRRRTF